MSDVIVIDDSDDDSPTNSVHESVPSVPESLPVPVTTPTSFLKNNNKKIADLLKQAFKLALEKETNDATQNDTKVAKPDVGNIRLKPIETITAPKFNKDKEDIVPELRYYKQNKSDVATSNTVVKEEIIKIEEHDVKQELMVQNAACTGNITVVNNTPGGVIIMNNGNNQELLLRNSAGTYSNVQATIAPSTSTQTVTNNPPNNPILIQLSNGNYGLTHPVQQYFCEFCGHSTVKLVDLKIHVALKHGKPATKSEEVLPKPQDLHKCPICSKVNSSMERLKNHIIDLHSNEPNDWFGVIWSKFGELTIKDNDNFVGYSCPYCQFIGKYPSDLRYHCATSHDEFHEEKVLRCLYCYYETEKHIHLSKHVRKHFVGGDMVCLYCIDFKTNTSEKLSRHFYMMHPRLRDGFFYHPNKDVHMTKILNKYSVEDSETTLAKSDTSKNLLPNKKGLEFKITSVRTVADSKKKTDNQTTIVAKSVPKLTNQTAIPDQIAKNLNKIPNQNSVDDSETTLATSNTSENWVPNKEIVKFKLTSVETVVNARKPDVAKGTSLAAIPDQITQKYASVSLNNKSITEFPKRPLLCPYCLVFRYNLTDLNTHIQDRHLSCVFLCILCKFEVNAYTELEEHESYNHPELFGCSFCWFRTFSYQEYNAHVSLHYKNYNFVCVDCDFKCFSYPYENSRKHVLTEHLTRKLRFTRDETLLFTHTQEISTAKHMICCNFCGFKETQTEAISMQIHLLMHFKTDSTSSSITCTDCNFRICVHDIINKHLDVAHPGQRQDVLNQYWLKKCLLSGEVNCPHCSYVFSIYRRWICHVNTKHPQNVLSQWTLCFICKLTVFRSIKQMSRHFQNNHMGYFQSSPAISSRYECAECNTTASLYWDHYFYGYIVCDHVGKRLQEEEEDPHFTRTFILMASFKQLLNNSHLPIKLDNYFFVNIVPNKGYYMEPIENVTQLKATTENAFINSNDLNKSAPRTVHKKLPHTKALRLNCPHCKKPFLALLQLSEHVRTTHNTSDLYHCVFCNFTNKKPNAVENHEADHTTFEKCIYCFYRCQKNPNNNEMDIHISRTHINKDFTKLRCVYCSYKVVPKEHQKLRQHFLRKHYTACGMFFDAGQHMKYIRENTINKCNLCNFTIKDYPMKEPVLFKIHLSVHFPLNDGIIHCAYCPRFTTDLEHYMHEHLNNEHKVLIKTATNTCNPKDLTQCRLCNFMTTKENIKNHEEMYHKDIETLEEPLRTTELSPDQSVVDLKVSQIETDSVKKTTLGGNASPVILNASLSKVVNVNTFFSWTDTSNTCGVLTLNEKSNNLNTTRIDTNSADKETQPNGAKSRRKQLFSELEDDYEFFTLFIRQQEPPPLSCISEIVTDNTLGFKITNVETVVEPSPKTSEETKSSVTQNIISDRDDDIDATVIITADITETPEPVTNKRKLIEDNSQSSEDTAEPIKITSELFEVTSEPLEVSNKKRIVNTYYNKKKRKIGSTPPLVEFGNVIPFRNLASEERNNLNEDEDDWNLVVMNGNDPKKIDTNDQLEDEDDTVILNSTDF